MGLEFGTQRDMDLIGTIDSPVTLTADRTNNAKELRAIERMQQVVLDIAYTPAVDGSDIQVYIEFSSDGDNWYRQTEGESAGSTGDIIMFKTKYIFDGSTNGTTEYIEVPIQIANKYIKISVDENTSGAFGTVSIRGVISGL